MSRRLFEDLVVSARGRRAGRGGLAFPASVGIHAMIVGGAVLLSVFGPSELMPEVTARQVPIFVPAPVQTAPQPPMIHNPGPRPAPGGGLSAGPPVVRPPAPVTFDGTGPPEADDALEQQGCMGPDCFDGGPPGPSMASIPTGDGDGSGPPTVVRASVDVAPPVRIHYVDPVYPELARRAGVEGIVIIECTIDPKGRIANARLLRGHPLLDRAALAAVQQWIYRPTLLSGAPVSVIMTVTVNFKIAR